MVFDPKEPGQFVLYDMEKMKEAGRFTTDPFFIVHMINAYDDPDNSDQVIVDSTNMRDGSVLEAYFYNK